MNPQEQLCPYAGCGASGKQGWIGIHSQKEQRYYCKQCQGTFSASRGTAYYGLKKTHEEFTRVITLLAYGCPVQAIVRAFGLDERTVWAWLERAGSQCKAVHEQMVLPAELELLQIQADELKVKTYLGTVWMGLVMLVKTRLWLGGAVEKRRGKVLLHRTLAYAEGCGRAGRVLVAVDGFNIYLEIIPQLFQKSWDWLHGCWQGWREVFIVQTMKQRRGRRGRIEHVIASGTPQQVQHLIRASQGQGGINTAYIERLNATFRLCLHCLVRSTRTLVRQPNRLEAWMWLVGSCYNFCTPHQSLRLKLLTSPRHYRWLQPTPAMATALTDHCWSVAELLHFKRPPSGWLLFRMTEGALPLPRYCA
jgi:transposase-like protein